ncbi:hypothetical protein SLA2020_497420 [Shorea laevis]
MEPLSISPNSEPPPKADESLPPPSPPPPGNSHPIPKPSTPSTDEAHVDLVEPKQKSFRDTLIDGNASSTPPLVTLEELIAVGEKMETVTPMVEEPDRMGAPKIPKVRIPKEI